MHTPRLWLVVTVRLAIDRPEAMTSTSMTSGSVGSPPRAKTVCSDRSSLSGTAHVAATTVWARICPPKTTPWPTSRWVARKHLSPSGSRSKTARSRSIGSPPAPVSIAVVMDGGTSPVGSGSGRAGPAASLTEMLD